MTMPGPPGGPSPEQVTDEDRNRFGMLLDSAAERGLLSPADYQVRLGLVAEATSHDELQRLVTELPAFAAPAAGGSPGAISGSPAPPTGRSPGLERTTDDSTSWTVPSARPLRGRGRGRGSARPGQWLVLALVVGILIVAMVVLTLMVGHLTPAHVPVGTGKAMGPGQSFGGRISPLRL